MRINYFVVCLAFCESSVVSNTFILGMNIWKHVYQRIAEPKDTLYHAKAVNVFLYNESSYSLEDNNISHGIFLEILYLISKFDDVLRHYLENIIS